MHDCCDSVPFPSGFIHPKNFPMVIGEKRNLPDGKKSFL